MSDRHYLVKFTRNGKTIYGQVQSYSDAAKDAAKRGEVIVEDAVLPTAYRVLETEITDVKMEIGRYDPATHKFVGQDEVHEYVQNELDKAQAFSDSLGDAVQVGKLFGTGVADGTAWYVVTKVSKKTCKVEWRGFCPDRYVDRWLGYGKTIPIKDIEMDCRRFDNAPKLKRMI